MGEWGIIHVLIFFFFYLKVEKSQKKELKSQLIFISSIVGQNVFRQNFLSIYLIFLAVIFHGKHNIPQVLFNIYAARRDAEARGNSFFCPPFFCCRTFLRGRRR